MDKFKTGQHWTVFATAAMFFSVYHHFWSCKIAWTLMQYIKCLSLLWSLNFTKMGITSWDFNQRNRQFQTRMENNTLFERPLSVDLEAWLISRQIIMRPNMISRISLMSKKLREKFGVIGSSSISLLFSFQSGLKSLRFNDIGSMCSFLCLKWISGKFPNGLWPPPRPFFGKNIAIFSTNRLHQH